MRHPSLISPAGAPAFRAIGLVAWFVAASVPIGYLMAGHLVPLPAAVGAGPGNALPTVSPAAVGGHWRVIHVLAGGCPCSAAVAARLAERGPQPGIEEVVYVGGVGTRPLPSLAARGFTVRPKASDALIGELSIRGGPWLVVLDPAGRVAYSGGYAAERPRPGVELQDLSIVQRCLAGQRVPPLPAFGCAIDPALRRAIDPLGLKYR